MMTAGTGGFSNSAAKEGPVAGYDPVLKMRGKLKKIKKNVKEETDRVNPKGPSRLFQYKINVPEVGETIVFANSPAELRMKLRMAIMPKYRSGINIERIMPGGAAKFFMDKRMSHMRNVKEEMGNIAHTKTKKDGKTIIKVNKNDELDAQAKMKNDPKYILGKTRVQPYEEGYSANPAQQAAIAIAKKEKKEGDMVAKKKKQKIMSSYDWRSQLESELGRVDECWKTHKKVGMKMKGGKLVPNCVPKNEEVQLEAKKPMVKVKLNPSKKIGVKVTDIGAGGKEYVRKDTMKEAKSPAWQRKAGKSESGGLNAMGVASYRAANPGSKLKTAVTTEPSKLKKGSKSANRRKSFCARMKGMKKRLTSAKTARDPDSRINKSLRKWNC